MAVSKASRRPALCTVPRGARSIYANGSGEYVVGGALGSGASNDVTTLQYSSESDSLTITSSTTHSFEIWALAGLRNGHILAGTRAGGESHARVLTDSETAHALRGRVLSLHAGRGGVGALAVTSTGMTQLAVLDGSLSELAVDDGEDDVVGGGYVGERAYVIHVDGRVELRDPRETRSLALRPAPQKLAARASALRVACAISVGRDTVAVGSQHGELSLVDLRTGTVREQRAAHHGWVSAIGASEDAKMIVSGGADGVVKIWNEELQQLAMLPHHADSVYGVAADDNVFATMSYEGRVAVNSYPSR